MVGHISRKKEQNCAICRDEDGPRIDFHMSVLSEREKQISYTSKICVIYKNSIDDLIFKPEIETET